MIPRLPYKKQGAKPHDRDVMVCLCGRLGDMVHRHTLKLINHLRHITKSAGLRELVANACIVMRLCGFDETMGNFWMVDEDDEDDMLCN